MPWAATTWNATSSGAVGPHVSSKHARQLYDAGRQFTVLTGGDRLGESGGNPSVYQYVAGSASTAGATPLLMFGTTEAGMLPEYPDNCTWCYSSLQYSTSAVIGTNGRYFIARSFWFGHPYSTGKQPLRSTGDWLVNSGIFNPNLSSSKGRVWGYSTYEIPTPLPFWGGDSNSNFGTFDPVQNAMVRLIWDGAWGCTLQVIPVGDLNTFPLSQAISCGSGHPSGSAIRNWVRNADCHARQAAIDINGRRLYCITQSVAGLDSTSDHGWGLLRVDLNDPTKGERLRLPPLPALGSSVPATLGEVCFRPQNAAPGDGRDYVICYDSVRNQVMFPQIIGYGGEIYNTLIYDVATSAWSVVDSNGSTGRWPVGNCFSFDPIEGCGVMTGGHGSTSPSLNHPSETFTVGTGYYDSLWKLTPGNSTAAQSTGTAAFVTAHVTALTGPINVTSSIQAGVYRFNVYDGVTTSFVATADSANPAVKFADFNNLILGKNYKFTGEHRTLADTGTIGGVATRFATMSGVPVSTSSASGADVNPPVITQIFPTSSDFPVSGVITFQYNVTDTEGVARVELRVNNALITNPTFDTLNLNNSVATSTASGGGLYFWKVDAWDLSSNHAQGTQGFNVYNPPPPPPDPEPTDAGVRAIFLNPTGTPDRVGYVMWADVPTGEEIPRPGFRSAWPGALDSEIAELEAGRVRERSGTMKRQGTDDEMKTRLIALWTAYNAEIQALSSWVLEDNFWDGTTWVKR